MVPFAAVLTRTGEGVRFRRLHERP